ncbi:MAG: ABC transporter substrate-binding protein [Candidatus Vecturithrix sp.]|jgi:ribose transport system substrate-binding protein|nr:ABC transporter substrate-binding protein [Candidatus Vecturithrix sp.]
MKSNILKGFVVVLLLGAIVTVGNARAEQFVIGLSDFSLGNSWRVQMVEEAKYAASQHSDLVKELIVTEADGDISKQIADIEDLIAKKVDAILITAANPKALVPVVSKAMAAGVVVVDFDNLVYTDNITAHIIVDQKEFGRVQGEWLVNALGGKGKIVAFNGMKGTSISAERFEGAKSVFDQHADIEIVQEVYADWDYAKAKRAMETLLAAYPSLDGIWSQGGAMSEAVIEAYLERGLTPPPVTGEDGNGFLKIWKELRDSGKYPNFDSIATSMPTWCSAKALEVALAALTGQPVEKETIIPIPTITSETLDQYVKPDLPDSFWCNSQLPDEIVKKMFER